MKRFVVLLLVVAVFLSLSSCGKEVDTFEVLADFISAYGADGVIYSPTVHEGEVGYIPEGLVERIYLFSGEFPENYAIFLNSRPEYGYECGLFVCSDDGGLDMMEEACLERARLLDPSGERMFVKRSGNTVFYSTMKDKERAEALWREIIR